MTENHLIPLHDSKNIVAMGYDTAARKLIVKFEKGSTYRYADVPADVYDELLAAHRDPARSLGKEFHSRVRQGGFSYEQI